jgi:hypothetical protein
MVPEEHKDLDSDVKGLSFVYYLPKSLEEVNKLMKEIGS